MQRTYLEEDFGAPHRQTTLVADAGGTVWAAFYDDGVWWEGHYSPDATKIQLDNRPIRLVDPKEFAR